MPVSSTTGLNQTIKALQGGLTSIPPMTALSLINDFEQQMSRLGATQVANDLEELKHLLKSGTATSSAIGQVLISLGSQTKSAATSAEPTVSKQLMQLGELLASTGASLS
jgi:L-fucose isomerase-like protein